MGDQTDLDYATEFLADRGLHIANGPTGEQHIRDMLTGMHWQFAVHHDGPDGRVRLEMSIQHPASRAIGETNGILVQDERTALLVALVYALETGDPWNLAPESWVA